MHSQTQRLILGLETNVNSSPTYTAQTMNPQNSSKPTKSQHKSKTKHTNIKHFLGRNIDQISPLLKKHTRLVQAGIVDFHPIYWYQIIKTYKKKKKKRESTQ